MRPRLVVLRPLGLGDFLTGVPAYRGLARHFPGHHRVLAVPRALHPLVAATGAFHEAVDVDALAPLPPALHAADVAVDLHGRGPASHRILLAARPKRLVAFANDVIPESVGGARWRPDEHEVRRWCRMLHAHAIAADVGDLRLFGDARVEAMPRGLTLVHPGAASEARRWPLERFVATIAALRERGHDVAVTGSASEAPRAAELARRSGLEPARDLAGRTSLPELSRLVRGARLVLSGDTGIAHLAVAHGTPTVTLFGPVSPADWGPPALPRHRVLWAGRTGDPHATVVDAGLLAIGVVDVMRELDQPLPRAEAFDAHAHRLSLERLRGQRACEPVGCDVERFAVRRIGMDDVE